MNAAAAMLAPFSAATIHESTGFDCVLSPSIRPLVEKWKICGPALPVLTAPGQNLWLHRAICQAQQGDILVVATGGGLEFGYWGEILATAAQSGGVGGLVIDGGVRDVRELREIGLPVFSRGPCIRGTGKDATSGGARLPIQITGVHVRPGDIVVGDEDGVVVVPSASVAEVAERAAQRCEHEARILEQVRAGETTLDLYGWS